MRLLKLREVDYTKADKVFRASALVQAGLAALFVAAIAGLICWRVYGGLPLILLIPSGAGLGLGAIIGGVSAVKAMRPSNWLLIWGQDRMLVKFRSYLNTQFPQDDPQVVCLRASEITAVSQSTLSLRTPSDEEGWSQQTSVYLEISVSCELSALKEALKHEHKLGRTEATAWQDYPVSLAADDVIRIEWKSPRTRVRPKISVTLRLLSRQFEVKEASSESLDLTRPRNLNRAEMDSQILALAERGRKMEAVKVARTTYGYSFREALEFVDGLSK
jgi:hypothetical protein